MLYACNESKMELILKYYIHFFILESTLLTGSVSKDDIENIYSCIYF